VTAGHILEDNIKMQHIQEKCVDVKTAFIYPRTAEGYEHCTEAFCSTWGGEFE
jgi:hypothetical protein